MAVINIPDEKRQLNDVEAMRAFLKPHGLWYEFWQVEGRLKPNATDAEILETYKPEIERVSREGGYTTVDVINVSPETPGLDALCEKFNKEHIHTEDEVRFCVSGQGLFHIHPKNGPVFSVTMTAGDMINVPKGTTHWFDLCATRQIKAIRFFQDKSGWTPHYVENGVHVNYQPLCWGPNYLPSGKVEIKPLVNA